MKIDNLNKSVQFGTLESPLHVVWARSSGKWARAAAKVNSAKVVIRDQETIDCIRAMEQAISDQYPQGVLKSCLGEEVASAEGKDSGVLCRMKITKNDKKFQTKDAWQTQCSSLHDLDYGHDFVAMGKARPFMHYESGTCGVTIYANSVYVVGRSEPFGRHSNEGGEEPGEPIVWR